MPLERGFVRGVGESKQAAVAVMIVDVDVEDNDGVAPAKSITLLGPILDFEKKRKFRVVHGLDISVDGFGKVVFSRRRGGRAPIFVFHRRCAANENPDRKAEFVDHRHFTEPGAFFPFSPLYPLLK